LKRQICGKSYLLFYLFRDYLIARRYYIQSALSVSDPDKMGLQTNFCIDATVKSAFERGYKVIVPQGANSTFDNDYMTGEETYKYYNDMMWPKRFATCVSVDEAIKLMES
jgi:hypothetical protein